MSTKDDIYLLAAGNRGFVCLASFSFRAAHLFSAIRGNSPRRGFKQPLGGGNSRSPQNENSAMTRQNPRIPTGQWCFDFFAAAVYHKKGDYQDVSGDEEKKAGIKQRGVPGTDPGSYYRKTGKRVLKWAGVD